MSSAYVCKLTGEFEMRWRMGIIKILNRIGPWTDLCATPGVTRW